MCYITLSLKTLVRIPFDGLTSKEVSPGPRGPDSDPPGPDSLKRAEDRPRKGGQASGGRGRPARAVGPLYGQAVLRGQGEGLGGERDEGPLPAPASPLPPPPPSYSRTAHGSTGLEIERKPADNQQETLETPEQKGRNSKTRWPPSKGHRQGYSATSGPSTPGRGTQARRLLASACGQAH